MEKQIKIYEAEIIKLDKKIVELQLRITQEIENTGAAKASFNETNRELVPLEGKIEAIQNEISTVQRFLLNNENVETAYRRRSSEISQLQQQTKSNVTEIFETEIEKSEKMSEECTLKLNLSESSLHLNIFQNTKIIIEGEWNKLITNPQFRVYVSDDLENKINPDYFILNEGTIDNLNTKKKKIKEVLCNLKNKQSNVEKILTFYNQNKFFPSSSNVTSMIEKLQKANFNVIYGWHYIIKSFESKPDIIKEWNTQFPFLLEGIVVLKPDFSTFKEKIKSIEFSHFERAVYFSSAKIFENSPKKELRADEGYFSFEEKTKWHYSETSQ